MGAEEETILTGDSGKGFMKAAALRVVLTRGRFLIVGNGQGEFFKLRYPAQEQHKLYEMQDELTDFEVPGGAGT